VFRAVLAYPQEALHKTTLDILHVEISRYLKYLRMLSLKHKVS
jgi:hypothetical protein